MKSKHITCFLLLIFAVGAFSACKVDPCESFVCYNGDPIQDGYECFCLCERGWFGDKCDQEDACQTQAIECFNEGTCVNGTCVCPVGFTGDTCEILVRDYYIGNYNAILDCQSQTTNINISIQAPDSLVNGPTELVILNLLGESYLYDGRINEQGNVIIPQQSILSGTVIVNGTFNRNSLGFIIEFQKRDSMGIEYCTIDIIK